uniref:Uncharacterized protein n=1 Tax=Rhizophora mucronata TaxID=61149 RepID=A0A2P2K8S6_RHIMU
MQGCAIPRKIEG